MGAVATAILFTLFLWWFSTGLILYLDGLPRRTFPLSLVAASGVATVALVIMVVSSHSTSAASAYLGFSCAICIWGWQEMAFLMGGVSGPRRKACPPHAGEFERFRFATEAIIYHELALLACLTLIFAATWKQPNQLGGDTFLLLWVMRLSAKLNLFFGVRNHYVSFLPLQLRYLASYFGTRSFNLLFPVSVTAATLVAVSLWQKTFSPLSGEGEIAEYSLLATLLSLAVLEHWFLVLPLSVEGMWRWALSSSSRKEISELPR